jgi:hypothetical protein
MNKTDPHHRRYYIIKVQGVMDECWLDWFNGMQLKIEEQEDGTCLSVLSGELKDQSSLHGKLIKLRDLNLPLVELRSHSPEESKY